KRCNHPPSNETSPFVEVTVTGKAPTGSHQFQASACILESRRKCRRMSDQGRVAGRDGVLAVGFYTSKSFWLLFMEK
ncbi:MAG: hypothetical protein KI790_18735, partial [Cyclobacteriaceae bacterium]|nr:hypothetical protein [Cyclobacteriaceae bacterium HetDA_MAG_MS6]